MVDLPEAERPVNQRVKPDCFRSDERASWVRVSACQVMFLSGPGQLRSCLALHEHEDIADLRRHCSENRSA